MPDSWRRTAGLIAGALGFVANVLTLAGFIYAGNFEGPSISGFTVYDSAIWIGFLTLYSVGFIVSYFIHNRREAAPAPPSQAQRDYHSGRIEHETLLFQGYVFYAVSAPFILFPFFLWVRAFLWDIPTPALGFLLFFGIPVLIGLQGLTTQMMHLLVYGDDATR
jgi:hypothetical protein